MPTQDHTPAPSSGKEGHTLLERALEELRLIRAKDTDAVYDTTLRVDLQLAIHKAKATAAEG